MIKIRLARGGSKNRPYYRIVVANITAPRDGKFLEKIGTYNPLLAKDDENKVTLNVERFKYWISVGAQPTERITRFEKVQAILGKPNIRMSTKKALPKKESA